MFDDCEWCVIIINHRKYLFACYGHDHTAGLQRCENGNKEERYDHKVKRIREVKNLRRVRKSCMGARDCYRRFMDP